VKKGRDKLRLVVQGREQVVKKINSGGHGVANKQEKEWPSEGIIDDKKKPQWKKEKGTEEEDRRKTDGPR